MAIIINHTRFCLGVNSKEFVGFVNPEGSLEVPDDVAQWWSTKPMVEALLEKGALRIEFDPKDLSHTEVTTDLTPDKVTENPKALHWRKAVSMVEALTDLNRLAELHATETRKRVLTAIEDRMAALQVED